MPDDMPIQNKIISKAVEGAQRKVENINFSMRKNVLEYDDVMNKQRQVIYAERNKILDGKDLAGHITDVMDDTVSRCVAESVPPIRTTASATSRACTSGSWSSPGTEDAPRLADESYDELKRDALAYVEECYEQKSERLGERLMRDLNTQVMLRVIDTRWMNYLQEMDYLKQGIGLRGFGQRDPLVEYKSRGLRRLHRRSSTPCTRTTCAPSCASRCAASAPEPPAEQSPALAHAAYSGPADPDGGSAALRDQAAAQAADAAGRAAAGHLGRRGLHGAHLPQGRERRPLRQRGSQRPVPLRQRQEVQELPRQEPMMAELTPVTPEALDALRPQADRGRVLPAPRREA